MNVALKSLYANHHVKGAEPSFVAEDYSVVHFYYDTISNVHNDGSLLMETFIKAGRIPNCHRSVVSKLLSSILAQLKYILQLAK